MRPSGKTMKIYKVANWQSISAILLLSTAFAVNAESGDISCLYETSVQPAVQKFGLQSYNAANETEKWYLWRTDKSLEVSNAAGSFSEKWTATDQKTVFYQAIYHDKKFLLDFQPSDLKILGRQTDLETRRQLFPKHLLAQLKQTGKGFFKTYKTLKYQGEIAGVEYKVNWLPELNLAARIEKITSDGVVITKLEALYPLDSSPYRQQSLEEYDDMDYADIGDNESHPVVAQLQKSIGIGYAHQH